MVVDVGRGVVPKRGKTQLQSSCSSFNLHSGLTNKHDEAHGMEDVIWHTLGNGEEEHDSEEEEANRIGDVPLSWYDKEEHIGYTIEGKRLIKTLNSNEIQKLIANADNPDFWKVISDEKNDKNVTLADEDIKILQRIKKNYFPSSSTTAEDFHYEHDNPEDRIFSSRGTLEPKSRFLPSKWESKKISRLVQLIRENKLQVKKKIKAENIFDLWGGAILDADSDQKEGRFRGLSSLPAPKLPMPTHSESYNPPKEYLFTDEEKKLWEEVSPDDRELSFIPSSFSRLRHVPLYGALISERFERCLDLYLCPRALKLRMNVDPDSLLPSLPSPSDLRPFPSFIRIEYEYQRNPSNMMIRALSVTPHGQWLAAGSDSGALLVFHVLSARIFLKLQFQHAIWSISWHPRLPIIAIGLGVDLYIIHLGLQNSEVWEKNEASTIKGNSSHSLLGVTDSEVDEAKALLSKHASSMSSGSSGAQDSMLPTGVWIPFRALLSFQKQLISLEKSGIVDAVVIRHESDIKKMSWHQGGNYLAVTCPGAAAPGQQCVIHALFKRSSIRPVRRSQNGRIRDVAFHPKKPWLFVAFNATIRLYNLKAPKANDKDSTNSNERASESKGLTLVQKFLGVEGVSSISVHPSGEHLLVGSDNSRVTWFDTGLGNKPFRVLRYHDGVVLFVGYHSSFPLMLSASDDGIAYVFHSKVAEFNLKNPLIVPLKKLMIPGEDFSTTSQAGITACTWHPTFPWAFVASKDGRILLLA